MYDYISVRIEATPCDEDVTDLLAAFLADIDFETFEPDEKGVTAYVRKDRFDETRLQETLDNFPIDTVLKWEAEEIKGEDWNEEWEKNYFKPILIGDDLVVRSSFHTDYPEAKMEIVIDPKMAFGTGHHSTTAGMCTMLLGEALAGKSVIDMGTGTGILAILCKKLGADKVTGIDIDEFAVENARENGELNGVEIEWKVGDERALEGLDKADVFLANINLNVITEQLGKYVEKLNKGGKIFLSGFLSGDREKIMEKAEGLGLRLEKEREENNWMTMGFEKKEDPL